MSLRIAFRRVLQSTTTARASATIAPATQRLSALRQQLAPRQGGHVQFRGMASSQDIPKQMCGVVINSTGGTEVLEYKEDIPVPSPGEGEILVKNEYTGINYIDTYVCLLFCPPRRSLSRKEKLMRIQLATSAQASTPFQHHINTHTFSAAKPPAPSSPSAQAKPLASTSAIKWST